MYTHIFYVQYENIQYVADRTINFFRTIPRNQDVLPRDYFQLQALGIQCYIRDAPAWQLIYQVLTHPIWFPLFCLIFTPLLAFVLIKREVKGHQCQQNHRILGMNLVYVKTSLKILFQATMTSQIHILYC